MTLSDTQIKDVNKTKEKIELHMLFFKRHATGEEQTFGSLWVFFKYLEENVTSLSFTAQRKRKTFN